jgi:hypothetical protein
MQHESISDNITTNMERYKEVLAHLWEEICLRCPKIWAVKDRAPA